MRKLPFILKRILMLAVVLSILSFTINKDTKNQVKTNEVSDLVISEWFPHEFNLNPASATSFKISDWNIESVDDLKVFVFGRNLLGTYHVPFSTDSQKYTYQLAIHHIEFKAESKVGGNPPPSDFFTEFRYIIIPNNQFDDMESIDMTNYREVVAHFSLKD